MRYKEWNCAPCAPAARSALERDGVPPLAAAVLCARGLDTMEKVRDFFQGEADRSLDPGLLRDMDRAVARVRRALEGGERIAVYGDYDVDGITATALLTQFLRREGGDVVWYIPDRLAEGYGLNGEAVSALAADGVKLIVTVDCGITVGPEAEQARALGVDLVITDHHECKDRLPDAAAVVDPHRPDCPYPFKHLAGVGVALKLALALGGPERREELLEKYADLAAVGTVADVMKLVGENRALVRRGLRVLERRERPGLAMLLREAGRQGLRIMAGNLGLSYILYLENRPEGAAQGVNAFLDGADGQLRRRFPQWAFFWGVGETEPGPTDFPGGYEHAALALKYCLNAQDSTRRFTYQNTQKALIVSTLSQSQEVRERAQRALRRLMDYDAGSEIRLMDTLIAYICANYNISQTARSLHIHRQSLSYRLEKIEQLTGMSLGSHEDLFLLEVYSRIYRSY